MINTDKIKNILTEITELGYNACVAGSSVYLDEGIPNDIDVYIDFRGIELSKFRGDLIDELCCEGEYTLVVKDPPIKEDPKSYASACDWIAQVENIVDNDGVVFNLIATCHLVDVSYPLSVVRYFDYGRIQKAYTIENIWTTPEYDKDVKNNTLTLRNVWSYYHLTMIGERIKKLQQRFPGHTIVIEKDFYKGSINAGRRKKAEMVDVTKKTMKYPYRVYGWMRTVYDERIRLGLGW